MDSYKILCALYILGLFLILIACCIAMIIMKFKVSKPGMDIKVENNRDEGGYITVSPKKIILTDSNGIKRVLKGVKK